MAVKLRLKKGDQVIVTTGPNRGKRGEILKVIKGDRPGDHRVVVGGVNRVKRHTRPSPKSPGGIIEREAPIHISNVMLFNPASGKGERVAFKVLEDGRKLRVFRSSGEAVDA